MSQTSDSCPLSWLPDGRRLVTVSRDGTLKLWRVPLSTPSSSSSSTPSGSPGQLECLLTCSPGGGTALTSVDLLPWTWRGVCLAAVGAEDGAVLLAAISTESDDSCNLRVVGRVPEEFCHGRAVNRLRWAPTPESEVQEGEQQRERELLLASASDDHTARVFRVILR